MFYTWSTQYVEGEENPYYVKLDLLSSFSPNERLWFLDYGRFKTFEEAAEYIETLPEPEVAAEEEVKMFLQNPSGIPNELKNIPLNSR